MTTKKTTELNPARSERYRYLETFRFLPLLVILCSVTLIVSTISWFRSERAIDESKAARATAEIWQTMYSETERECRLAQMEVDNFKLVLAKAGLNVDHIGEKP